MKFEPPVTMPAHVDGPPEGTTLPFRLVSDGGTIKIVWDENGNSRTCDRAHRILWLEYIRLYNFIQCTFEAETPEVLDRWRAVRDYVMHGEVETQY